MALAIVDELWERDYFVEAFGYSCVDTDWNDGILGKAPERWFLVNLGRGNVWPIHTYGETYDVDAFFDVIEALHDLVAKPVDGWFHDYAGCGMHWNSFDRPAGQAEFRAQLNPLLARNEMPLELSVTGEVIALAPEEMHGLLEAASLRQRIPN